MQVWPCSARIALLHDDGDSVRSAVAWLTSPKARRVAVRLLADHCNPPFLPAAALQARMCFDFLDYLLADLLDAAEELASSSDGSTAEHTTAGAGSNAATANGELGAAVAALQRSYDALDSGESVESLPALAAMFVPAVTAAARVAALLLSAWATPEQQAAQQLEMAQAAATRSCAYLRCANLGGEGGPFARQGADSKRCRCVAAAELVWGRFCCVPCTVAC